MNSVGDLAALEVESEALYEKVGSGKWAARRKVPTKDFDRQERKEARRRPLEAAARARIRDRKDAAEEEQDAEEEEAPWPVDLPDVAADVAVHVTRCVTVCFVVAAAGPVTLSLTYQVSHASWTPSYGTVVAHRGFDALLWGVGYETAMAGGWCRPCSRRVDGTLRCALGTWGDRHSHQLTRQQPHADLPWRHHANDGRGLEGRAIGVCACGAAVSVGNRSTRSVHDAPWVVMSCRLQVLSTAQPAVGGQAPTLPTRHVTVAVREYRRRAYVVG